MRIRPFRYLLACALLVACADDEPTISSTADAAFDTSTGDAVSDASGSDDTGSADTASDDASADDTSSDDTSTEDATADASEDAPTVDVGADTEPADTGGSGDVLVECEDLRYEITCDDPSVRTGGYYACSDYFGDTTGVEVQCAANPMVDVRNGGPPCAGYEHFVGSCVYYSEALPDRCYVTHVGAESADLVEAGRSFWRTACAGEWIE